MNSHDTMNQPREVPMRRVNESPDPNDRLLERILSSGNMLEAWKRVKANKGAAGVDKMTIADFPSYSREKWDNIRAKLRDGIYQPLPVKRVEIPKPSGGTRPLGIPTVIPIIDHWLRRRVRMCYWKQWRRVRTRIRNLLKMGAKPGVAIPICQTRKGPWKCARTLATQTGMTNKWLKDQGLVSVKELWVNIHYPATAR